MESHCESLASQINIAALTFTLLRFMYETFSCMSYRLCLARDVLNEMSCLGTLYVSADRPNGDHDLSRKDELKAPVFYKIGNTAPVVVIY